MSVYDIIPNQVELKDVRDTLNFNGGVAGNTVDSLMTEAAQINWASKHKPVNLNVDFCQDFDESKLNYDDDWWTAYDGNCGLKPKLLNHYTDVVDATDDNMNGWIYELPRGDSFFPYRLGDFAGYYPSALPIVANFGGQDPVYATSTNFSFGAMAAVKNEKSLTLGDFPILKDYYFGVLVVKKGSKSGYRATSLTTVENGIGSPIFPTNILSVGSTYEAYPFLSSQKYENWSDIDKNATYYSLPGLKKFSFSVKSSNLSILMKAFIGDDNNSIVIEIIKVTSAGGSMSLKNNYIFIRQGDKDFDDPMVNGEKLEKLQDFTATSDGITIMSNKTYTGLSEEVMKNPKIWLSLDSGTYLQFVIPFKPVPIP